MTKTISYQSLFDVPLPPPLTAVAIDPAPTIPSRPRNLSRGSALSGRSQFAYSQLQAVTWDQAWQPYRVRYKVGGAVKQRVGFLASSLAPWHEVKYEQWPRPPRRQSMTGDDGTQLPLVVQVAPWWETAPAVTVNGKRQKFAAVARGNDGDEGPINLGTFGFDVQQWQARHPRFRNLDDGDRGIEAKFSVAQASPWGYAFDGFVRQTRRPGAALVGRSQFAYSSLQAIEFDQHWQPLYPKVRRFEATRQQQIGFFAAPPPISAFLQDHQSHLRAQRREISALKHRVDFAWFTYAPYFFDQPWQPPRPRRNLFLRGDDGTSSPFVPPTALSPWGHAFDGFVARFVRRGAALAGRSQFAYSQLTPMTWEVWLPASYRVARNLAGGIKQRIGFGVSATTATIFVPQFDQFWQPPRPRWERGQGMVGGSEFAWFTYVPYFFDQTWQAKHPLPSRAGALFGGDIGSESPFRVAAFAAQFDQAWQPPHPRRERAGTLFGGDVGTEEPFVVFAFGSQFDQAWQPPRRPWERRGAFLRGDEGDQAKFAPTFLTPWFEVDSAMWLRPPRRQDVRSDDGIQSVFIAPTFAPQFDQPFHARLRPKPAPLTWQWNVDTGLLNLRSFTEVQPTQPPRRPWERRGAFLRGHDGNEGTEPVPTPPFGWFVQPWQPPRRRWERWAGIAPRDDQAQFPLLNLRVFTEVQPPQPPRRPWERRGSILRGDDQAPYPLPFLFPIGWEPNLPLLVHRFWHDPEIGDGGITFPFTPTILGPSVCFAGDVAVWVAMAEDGTTWVVSAADIAESES